MQKYASRKGTVPQTASLRKGEQAPETMSKSALLHMSGAGAPQPMSPALREKFEPSFGADFSNIRISRGHIPEEMGVQAVAKGTDILLDSRAGMDVIGHELAHVVQQAQGQVQGGFPVVHNAALEHQADVMGARAASGLSAMEGGMSGLGGGEMMSIAPMTSASAPAQCKSKEEKKAEKERKAEKKAQKREMRLRQKFESRMDDHLRATMDDGDRSDGRDGSAGMSSKERARKEKEERAKEKYLKKKFESEMKKYQSELEKYQRKAKGDGKLDAGDRDRTAGRNPGEDKFIQEMMDKYHYPLNGTFAKDYRKGRKSR